MFLKLFQLLNKFPPLTLNRYTHKYIFKMDKAYLRHLGDNEQFQITFKYTNEVLKVNRQFNFNRKLSETVETFLSRVATNVEKALNKKNKKRKADEDNGGNSTVRATLFLNDSELPRETVCSDIFQPGNNVVLKILSQEYQVIINSPWVDGIALPTSILATFPVYPSKFETVFTDKDLSVFTWFKSKNLTEWTTVGNSYILTPSNEEIDHYLKLSCVPNNSEFEGPEIEAVSTCRVEASPGLCPFEIRHKFTAQRAKGKEFRVVTYNILADLYCDSDYTREVLHPYCPAYALKIDYRKQLILKELIGYNADIICLQEVDRKVFNYDLQPTLDHLGYESYFSLKGGEVAEGLAFFFNKNRFKKSQCHYLVFSEHINSDPQFADIWEKIAKNSQLSERILGRTTTLQVNVVESLEYDEILVVANTHLYFHPDADHIRLLHGGLCIRYLENFVNKLKQEITGKRISLIFCGDFNSVPECGIYKLYTTGSVPKDFIDYSSNMEESVQDVELTQNFQLDSACGTPKYTNFTAGFADCLDYIYYEKSNLAVSQVVPLPSHEEVTQHTALPSIVFPSDHMSLVSDLRWL
ncbi:2',5'-phosphodiesterase 12 [Anoplophora glabripennis]|uniref:2',5'-phosphodiesterase 12 n=1 Tax=Anoplophora glabripennis TaxID=217634 RepID=UPI000875355F|nr:2',5'-phosphodiesterase 12 [Anoplophora glabripennis]